MAGKEAVFLLIDVGKSMHKKISGQEQPRLDVAIDCMKEYLQQKIFNSKQTHIGVILYGINPDENGQSISYIQEIEKPTVDLVRNIVELKNHEVPDVEGDLFSALDQTIATVEDFVGTKKFTKTIFVFTNGAGGTEYDKGNLKNLITNAARVNCKINVITLDFMNDYEPGQDPEEIQHEDVDDQTVEQNQNQQMLLQIKKQIPENIEMFNSKLAISMYKQFKTKQVTTRVSFKDKLVIFDDIAIDIEVYKKCTQQTLPSLKQYSKQVDFNPQIQTGQIEKTVIEFIQDDPQQEPVNPEEVIKGYYYGKQLVPITQAFEEEMKFQATKGMKLLGFTAKSNVPRHFIMKDVDILVPQQSSKNRNALVALIKSCKQLNKVAIVRYVFNARSAPKLCVLIPHYASNYECFYMAELPTSESIRDYQFASLKESTKEQQQAISNLIDKMDLTKVKDEDGDETEILEVKHTFNPTRQYFFQTVMHRAFQQTENTENNADELGNEEGLPEVNPVINEYLRPEQQIYDEAAEELKQVKEMFELEIKEEKDETYGKLFWKDLIAGVEQPGQQQDEEVIEQQTEEQQEIQELKDMKKGKFAFDDDEDVKNVSEHTPIEDFRKMVENKKEDLVEKAIKQISSLILDFVTKSFDGEFYNKALACLREFRKTAIKQDEVDAFNDFLKKIKKDFGDAKNKHSKFWLKAIKDGQTLILQSENQNSNVTIAEAMAFNHENDNIVQQIQTTQQQNGNQYDDLEDELD